MLPRVTKQSPIQPACLFGVLILLGTSPVGLGNGMRLVSQDAFAAARGEAFAATADNASAIHYNPAGLTQLSGHNFRSGFNALYFEPTFRPPAGAANAGTKYEIEDNTALAPQFYYAYRFDDVPVSLGMGMYAPHGASITWPQDTGFRAVATEGELTYLRINPVVAVEVLPGLSLAAGVMVDYGDIRLEQGLRRTERPFDNNFLFEGDDWSVGYNLGLLWKVNEQVSIGATLRSATTLDFDGKTKFVQQPIIQPTSLDAKAEFEFPMTAVFGVSYRPTPEWNLEFNVDYTDWSSFDTITVHQDGRPPFPVQQDIPFTLNWKDSWMYKIGVTRYLEDGWHVSAGYLFNENSVPDDFYTPMVADLDRHFLSIGIGHRGERVDFDLTYQLGFSPKRTVTNSAPPSQPGRFAGQSADGTYDFTSHALLVSVGVRF
jgi:long-chain fatty acid transport protein